MVTPRLSGAVVARLARRVLVVCLLLSPILPPAAPALAAGGQIAAAGEASGVTGLPRQEYEPLPEEPAGAIWYSPSSPAADAGLPLLPEDMAAAGEAAPQPDLPVAVSYTHLDVYKRQSLH